MKILDRLIKSELISGSFFIFAGSMFSNFLAFLLNLFLARSLSYSDYAIFASLLSVITLANIPAGSINTIIIKFAADYFIKGEDDNLKSLYLIVLKFIFGLSVGVIFLFVALSVPLAQYLKINDYWYIIISGLVIASLYLNIVHTAFLQSFLKFKFISFVNIIGGGIKLIIGIILVFLGFKAFGGIWSIFFMSIGMFLLGFIPLRKFLKVKSFKKLSLHTGGILRYALPTFVTVLFLTSFTSTDVILVKHFFNPQLAGYYAGLSLVGKVIFYFTFPIPMVMFPLLIKRHAKGAEFNNLFYLALILVILPSVFITAFYFLFPRFVINLFLGGREYLYVAEYLGVFGLYVTVFSMVNVCVNFFLSLNKTNISFVVVMAAVLQIVLIYIFHSNFYEVIGVSLLVSIALLIYLLFIYLKNYGNLGKIKDSFTFLNTPGI